MDAINFSSQVTNAKLPTPPAPPAPPKGPQPIGDVMELACTAEARERLAAIPPAAPKPPVVFDTYRLANDPLTHVYRSGMTIDADGAPNAYGMDPANSLDNLANAGKPCRWWGIATDNGKPDGLPVLNGEHFVSTTSLQDTRHHEHSPLRYVDSTKIPYIVLPPSVARATGLKLGDMAFVINEANGRAAAAIYADVGPANHLGEGSIALADALGVNSNAKKGGAKDGITYVVFPGSGNGQPRDPAEIAALGKQLFEKAGGRSAVQAIFTQP